jgi:hypothetical protein
MKYVCRRNASLSFAHFMHYARRSQRNVYDLCAIRNNEERHKEGDEMYEKKMDDMQSW